VLIGKFEIFISGLGPYGVQFFLINIICDRTELWNRDRYAGNGVVRRVKFVPPPAQLCVVVDAWPALRRQT